MKKSSFESPAGPPKTERITTTAKKKEAPIPWEFRIHRLDRAIVIPTRTIPERFNYWEMTEAAEPELRAGYHTASETSNERTLGELIPTPLKPGDENTFILIKNNSLDPKIMRAVLPAVLEDLKKQGIVIRQVVEASSGDQRMAA